MLPKITSVPQDQDKVYGDQATLTIHASGPDELTYRWIKDGKVIIASDLHLYRKISDLYSPTLQIEFFLPKCEGIYRCAAINKYGLVISDAANLKGMNLSICTDIIML